MDIRERMARQMHRVKVDAAIAAMKTPPPDYVFREPRMPEPMTEQQKVKAFVEDRTYDDIPMEKSKIDPRRVVSMADVARIIVSEQPREFVIGPKDQVDTGLPSFRTIGQESIEGPGYTALKANRDEDDDERIARMSSVEDSAPALHGIKIDLSGGIGKPGPATKPSRPQETPVASQPETPAQPASTNVPPGTIEMTDAQRQMLAAMRAQRGSKIL